MSKIASMPESLKMRTQCGLLYGKNSIVGRYAKVGTLAIYECLVCGREDFTGGASLIEHVQQEHKDR